LHLQYIYRVDAWDLETIGTIGNGDGNADVDRRIGFGFAADPKQTAKWMAKPIKDDFAKDDPPAFTFNNFPSSFPTAVVRRAWNIRRGTISFFGAEDKDSRTCRFFIDAGDRDDELDGGRTPVYPGEQVIGKITPENRNEWINTIQNNFNKTGYNFVHGERGDMLQKKGGRGLFKFHYGNLDMIKRCYLQTFNHPTLGKWVTWTKEDEDIPRGTVGEILGPDSNRYDSLRVKFPEGEFRLAENSLRKAAAP